jgi:hypothetical protein
MWPDGWDGPRELRHHSFADHSSFERKGWGGRDMIDWQRFVRELANPFLCIYCAKITNFEKMSEARKYKGFAAFPQYYFAS